MPSRSILAGPLGLRPGTELTFFYPSTEWRMAQSFECFCNTKSCRGRIAGASDMSAQQLEGMWLNGFIREMLEERDLAEGGHTQARGTAQTRGNGTANVRASGRDGMRESGVGHWHVQSQSESLMNGTATGNNGNGNGNGNGKNAKNNGRNRDGGARNDADKAKDVGEVGAGRMGPTSRELSGEMGGDTKSN
jgi:hypothetical protein